MADFKTAQPGDPAWLAEAFKLNGLAEGAGEANNPTVLKLYAEAGFAGIKSDATAWCAAFAGAMLRRAGYRASGSLAARSYLAYGDPVDVAKAKRGDIVVFKRGNSTWQGHVAFFLAKGEGGVWVLGGNQSDQVKPAFYKSVILGVRRPSSADRSHEAAAGPDNAKPTKPAEPAGDEPTSAALVKAVQQALADRGYHEVGNPDGRMGTKTRGAILAFEADNERELTGKPSAELLAAILAADRRPVSPERAEGKPEGNPVLQSAGALKGIGAVLGGTSIVGIADPIVSQIEGGAGLAARLKTALEPFAALWPLGVLIAAGVVIWLATRSGKSVVEAYRDGRLSG